MITVERFDVLKEAMNAAYIPGQFSRSGEDAVNQSDFLKTFEKNSYDDSVNISPMDQSDDRPSALTGSEVDKENNHKADSSKEVDNTASHKTDNPRDKQNEATQADKKSEKSGDAKEGTNVEKEDKKETEQSKDKTDGDKSSQTGDDGQKTGKNGDKNSSKTEAKYKESVSMKDLLNKHGIKEEDLGEVKSNAKEQGADAAAKASSDTAEKVVMKTLNTDDKGQSAKTANTSNENKNTEEMDLEKRLMNSLDPEKKAESTLVKEELRVHKAQPKNSDNPAFNLLHESPKQAPQVKDIKVKQTLTNNQLLEQYEVIRDRINENVENGIKFLMTKGESKVTIQLKPPELGKVQMELVIKDNQVSAKINTENTAVKEVIMSNLDQLKANLAQAGHTINKFDIEVGGFKNHFDQQFSNNKSGGNGGGNGNGSGNGSGHEGDGDEAMRGKIINHRAVSYYLGQSINVII